MPDDALTASALHLVRGAIKKDFRDRYAVELALFEFVLATEVRVHEATRLLRETREPLKQIADACGFANANHFCKVFRRFQHVSPAAYRDSVK